MRIKYKLFLLILIANITLAFIMYMLTIRSFSGGFIHYIEATEKQKLTPLINDLAFLYTQKSNWDWVNTHTFQWHELIHKHVGSTRRPVPNTNPNSPQSGSLKHIKASRTSQAPKQKRHIFMVGTPIYLKDKYNQLITGDPQKLNTVRWLSITSKNQVVGHIGYVKKNILSNHLNTLFVQEQEKNFLWIALLLIFVSALFALPAADLFLRPLNRISKMLTQMAKGNFTKRLKIASRDEMGDLSQHLNSLAITLEKNLQARQQWVADISHELRTPVAILKGEIEAIQDGIRYVTPATLLSLQYEIERLTQLINDLHELTLADIGALSYQKEPVNFFELLQERLDTQTYNLQQSHLQLIINPPESPIILIGDVRRLEQLIDNLLQNSLRYTDASGVLKISLTLVNKISTLIWEDSSPGVNDLDLIKLTQPLYRAEYSRNRNTGGSGLGLAICQKIVEAHQGALSVAHSTLGGIAIEITLPAPDTAQAKEKY